ncbi:MAG: HAMP domain-containing histidine kinase [Butyrivibrio sp.]|nr:HAMP domain-containing histidine kinase [Butyrivibrio sp.]
MFYFIFIIIVLILFFLTRNDRRESDKYLITVLTFFMIDIIALILYISKDAYYYNVLNQFFSFPKPVWNILMFSNIPQAFSLRMMNLATLFFIYFSMMFTFEFMSDMRLHRNHRLGRMLILYLCVQAVLYDPWVNEKMYWTLCDNVFTSGQIMQMEKLFSSVTVLGNNGLILLSIVLIFAANQKVSSSNFFRIYALGECICYTGVEVAFVFIFWFAPSFLIKISKLADYTIYQQVPLTQQSHKIYSIFPYYLTFAGAAILYYLVKNLKLQQKLDNNRLYITRQIDAADTTSKAFCHYMKNEILAIQSEIDLLEVKEDNAEMKKQLLKDCSNLYDRLDEIHRSTKMSQLVLKRTDLKQLMDEILERMQAKMKGCRIVKEYQDQVPDVMLDANYFEQAVHNIIVNALDAMEREKDRESVLNIQIEAVNNWVQMSITDNGIGIPEDSLNKIFTPFVSSQPIKQHWGIGLSLTYKIIAVHGGKIEVTSQERRRTTFKILLPSIMTPAAAEEKIKKDKNQIQTGRKQ